MEKQVDGEMRGWMDDGCKVGRWRDGELDERCMDRWVGRRTGVSMD